MRSRPLYWTSLLFLSGMVISHILNTSYGSTIWLLLLALIPLLSLLSQYPRIWIPFGLSFLFAAFGFFYYSWEDGNNRTSIPSSAQEVILSGTLKESVDVDGDIVRFLLLTEHVDHLPVRELLECRIILRSHAEQRIAENWKRGSSLQFPARLTSPSPMRNPGTLDYQSYLHYKRVHWIAYASSFAEIMISPPSRFRLDTVTESVQRYLSESLDRLFSIPAGGISSPTAGIMKGMLLGIRSEISQQVSDEYSKLGFSHVLAISGLHMTVIIGAIWHLLRQMGLTRELSVWITMAVIPCYAIVTGAGPSVIRSAIMAMIGLWGVYLQRKNDGLNLWGAALWAMLLYDPYYLWDIGFQLSFGVTWGLIVLSPGIQPLFRFASPFLSSLLAVTLSAQLISLPLTIYYFHQYNILSFAVNLLFVPLFSLFVVPVGFMALLVGLIHPGLGFFFSLCLSFAVEKTHAVFGWLADLAWLNFHVMEPSPWKMGIYYIVLLGGLWIIKERKLLWILVSCTAAFFLFMPWTAGDKVMVTFLDVGQGDAAVVEMPNGKVYLIDGGGTFSLSGKESWKMRRSPFDPGQKVIIPFLKSRGIQEIHAVIMTHGDLDHIGGLASVIEEFPIEHAFTNGAKPGSELEKDLMRLMLKKGIQVHEGKAGIRWTETPGIRWLMLHPDKGEGYSDNDRSIVLLLDAYGYRLLFTGDLEKEGERVLLKKQLPPIDVLKVGHHGSRTSTSEEWAASLHPRISVISAGQHNRFGHPHEETLATLKGVGSQIYRTDEKGAIMIEIARDRLMVKTSLQQKSDPGRQ